MGADDAIFALHQVSHRFGCLTVLRDINLQIQPGERVALVGSSGAGKSTLIRLLNGTLQPSQGEVWALGQDFGRLSPSGVRRVQRQIGTVYQQFNLIENLRVIHNVNAGNLGCWSLLKAAVSLVWPLEVHRAHDALVQVGIPDKLYARTDQLSGGQQQRVALARVLVQNPQVILADEPIASLDPVLSQEVMDLLRDWSQTQGVTLVASLHAIAFARSHYQRIIGLRQGRILFDAPAPEVSQSMIEELYRLAA